VQTVLLVDDEFAIVEVLEAVLTDAGYRLVTAVNGRQALERAATHRPALILLDFMMPLLDGPGVLRALKADPALEDIPVILMTSLPENVVKERAQGYAAFIRKPFMIKQLLEAIEATLR
jgi:CheY-like chemotaxis protein